MGRRARAGSTSSDDLFSVGPRPLVRHQLAALAWPEPTQVLVNYAGVRVRDLVWTDMVSSQRALVVAGFASIAKIVELSAARDPDGGTLRVLLGTEPFGTERVDFGSPEAAFTREVRRYWVEERGVSLRLSAKIVQAITSLDQGRLEVRFMPGEHRLHAKLYVGDLAVTIGSSNFTEAGLVTQFEANGRFERKHEPARFDQFTDTAENFWQVGRDWSQELRLLLGDLLQFVSWEEALARACADLLEGQWAARYLGVEASRAALWPSQLAGIAQAMWVVENVGSVLVADATGSGKTRMGAHLTRAVRDRLWSTGRVRGDLTVLVCPPAVEQQWLREAVTCGLTLQTVSQGLLSRPSALGDDLHEQAVGQAQILAVDEAHNFLSSSSNRTRQVRDATADHVLLFTATPINRGKEDLLSLVDLLGADNFDDETLELLDQLARQRHDVSLTGGQRDLLRREIQRFTVRRTKSMLNQLVDQDPVAYRHPSSGRPCRYPTHQPVTYSTGETTNDQALAVRVRAKASEMRGLSLLGLVLAVPATLRHGYTDERWLALRLGAATGLAGHHVLSAMRSSTAALLEHIVGTAAALETTGITGLTKPQATGNMLARVRALRERGRPRVELTCELPAWLSSNQRWDEECERELDRYQAILDLANGLSDARERTKANLLREMIARHPRVLAFDRHPISLAAIARLIEVPPGVLEIATGPDSAARKRVRERFALTATATGIALCTDAMSEGLNLQGASVIVHLDLPTTLRVAEQRVGRVDRMDSPHDVIEAWWPDDGEAFATRANELLIARNDESASLLGSNLPIPQLGGSGRTRRALGADDALVDVLEVAHQVETRQGEVWDGIHDALDPVRRLVSGPDALLSPKQYELHRTTGSRVLARISPVTSAEPWVFFAARAHAHGAPRWIVLFGANAQVVHGLEQVTRELSLRLADRPASRELDAECEHWLDRYLRVAAKAEVELLPRRLQRALDQMHSTCRAWAQQARHGPGEEADRWESLARLARPADDAEVTVDPHQVAERWLQLIQPAREQHRRTSRRNRYSRISDINQLLLERPLSIKGVEDRLQALRPLEPFDQRVSACILGVPETPA